MSIYRARLHDTSNVLMLRMSSEQIRLQVSSKLFGVNSWIPQIIRQWIPDGPATENAPVPKVPVLWHHWSALCRIFCSNHPQRFPGEDLQGFCLSLDDQGKLACWKQWNMFMCYFSDEKNIDVYCNVPYILYDWYVWEVILNYYNGSVK